MRRITTTTTLTGTRVPYATICRTGERRAEKRRGAQNLETLALQERGRGTLRQVRRSQVDAQRARNGERRIADRLLVAHADKAGLHDRRADGQVKVACSGLEIGRAHV